MVTRDAREDSIRRLLGTLPDRPGIYVFRDADGVPLYVGKAISLRKRVRSYFRQGGPPDERIRRMLKRMRDFDFVVTANETEALLLESNFIKHHHPPYNIMLRDDKSYPFVAITSREEFPRVILTRKPHRAGITYFGPFTSVRKVRETLELLGKIFPYRKCHGIKPGRRTGVPCLNYHIGLCLAPCAGKIDQEGYRALIARVERLLSGKPDGLAQELQRSMREAATGQRYEEAAFLRNRLLALEHMLENQRASAAVLGSLDVFGMHAEDDVANVQVLQVRDGLLSDRRSFFLRNVSGEAEDDILEQFLIQYYATAVGIPSEVTVPAAISDIEALSELLTETRGARVEVRRGVRGKRRQLARMAAQNAELALKQDILREEEKRARPARALAGLKDGLGLPRRPMRIECYDISNTGGEHPVGSMVVFEGGLPRRDHYRKFGITAPGPDDFAMMAELISRRFARAVLAGRELEEDADASFGARPDLVVVDGGAGQVSAAAKSLEALGVKGIPVIGLAKKREEIYLHGRRQPVVLPDDSAGLNLLVRIRDEAHRFAITFHRARRGRQISSSILDELPGIGPSRKRAILEHFGSPERFVAASRDELEAVPGLPAKTAREVYSLVHKLG
ncbi:MAG: excinuclease ABC subunit UvrC [Thermoleophilia bacterium]